MGYDLANASYDSVSSPSLTGDDTFPLAFWFKPDGTKLYVAGNTNKKINQYPLSTAWDLTTIGSSEANSGSLSTLLGFTITPYEMEFNAGGTKVFVLDQNNQTIYEIDLGTAWDISTVSYNSVNFLPSENKGGISRGFTFGKSGTKLYWEANESVTTDDRYHEYDVSPAHDLGTAPSYTNNSLQYSSIVATPQCIITKPDGTKFYIGGQSLLRQCSFGTAWDISTGSYDSIQHSFTGQDGFALNYRWKPDGSKLYALGVLNKRIYQYSTGDPEGGGDTFNLSASFSVDLVMTPSGVLIPAPGPPEEFLRPNRITVIEDHDRENAPNRKSRIITLGSKSRERDLNRKSRIITLGGRNRSTDKDEEPR